MPKTNKNPPKVVFLYTKIDQAIKLGVDPSLLQTLHKDVATVGNYWSQIDSLLVPHLKEVK